MKFLASPDERSKGVTFFELVNSQHALKFLKMVELFSIPSRSQTLDRTGRPEVLKRHNGQAGNGKIILTIFKIL